VKNIIPFRAQPMLATLVREPFNRKGWVYEEKYDGYRVLAYKEGPTVRLFSRNAIDRTARFSRAAAAVKTLRPATLLLDGEVVVFDSGGISRFQLLQRATTDSVLIVFDCLFINGRDIRREPLSVRRAALEQAISEGEKIRASKRLAANGLEAYKIAGRKGLEGIIAKDLSSPYVESRSIYWLKVKLHQQDEFVIGGFTKPSGGRKHLGALLLGAYSGRKLYYVGKVGTGFNEDTLAAVYSKLHPLVRKESPFIDLASARDVSFVAPGLVAQISYHEITADWKIRQAVFLGLRDDKKSIDVKLPRMRR
jgi:bifunctional non-homologous end joining protein LigD